MILKEPKQNLNSLNCVSLYSHETYSKKSVEGFGKAKRSFSGSIGAGLLSNGRSKPKGNTTRFASRKSAGNKENQPTTSSFLITGALVVVFTAAICFTLILIS
ncbi:hypothetical protein [Rubellicoccus peritrichatus]|uniref:Uncharacterized protein n=1 Tax=Rubellicoccus peritrichatus TaxID=3080537 RepID=A0AAQ3LAA8_9BACT|nr:hypothetical protein [Puniceicoccus sp. CR14]WOO41577.1 hypothetical protein RZN69_00650 [Puniceicoccus sp. CR14]